MTLLRIVKKINYDSLQFPRFFLRSYNLLMNFAKN